MIQIGCINNMYTFVEWLAACDSKDFNNYDKLEYTFAIDFIQQIMNDILINGGIHYGDCTNQSCPCDMCILESKLTDYREYVFDTEKWLEENKEFIKKNKEIIK